MSTPLRSSVSQMCRSEKVCARVHGAILAHRSERSSADSIMKRISPLVRVSADAIAAWIESSTFAGAPPRSGARLTRRQVRANDTANYQRPEAPPPRSCRHRHRQNLRHHRPAAAAEAAHIAKDISAGPPPKREPPTPPKMRTRRNRIANPPTASSTREVSHQPPASDQPATPAPPSRPMKGLSIPPITMAPTPTWAREHRRLLRLPCLVGR